MKLWIRSQDKNLLIEIYAISLFQKTIFASNKECKEFILGTYSTEKRALEVLDEIQNILKPQMIISKVGKPIAETCDGTVYIEPNEYDIKELSTYVYEMPEE